MMKNKKSTIAVFLALLFVTSTVFSYPVLADTTHDLTGTWTWTYYNNGVTPYEHKMMITSFNSVTGDFSGTGYYVATPGITWTVTGTADGSNVEFDILYTGNNAGYTVDAEGTIDANGIYMSGDATTSASQSGTWIAEIDVESLISLSFPDGSTAVASLEIIEEANLPPCIPMLPEGIGQYIKVEIIEGFFDGTVTVSIRYDDTLMTLEEEQNLRLYMGDCVDFNRDGTINGMDLSLILKGIRTSVDSSPMGVPFDVDNDLDVDEDDVNIVKEYMTNGLIVNPGLNDIEQARLPWLDITLSVDTTANIIIGETDHFSIFRGR